MSSNKIHPTAVIGDDVDLGTGNVIGPYSVLDGPLVIGDDNWFAAHVAVGAPAQWSGMRGPEMEGMQRKGVRIGNGNVFREFVTIHQGTDRSTTVGHGVYLMAYAHIPHDALVLDSTTITNAVQLAGHTQIGWNTNIGLGSVVHQRSVIGPFAMIGMQSVITADVPPGAIAFGSPARVRGANKVGLSRAGFDAGLIDEIDAALRHGEPLPRREAMAAAVSWFEEKVATARP